MCLFCTFPNLTFLAYFLQLYKAFSHSLSQSPSQNLSHAQPLAKHGAVARLLQRAASRVRPALRQSLCEKCFVEGVTIGFTKPVSKRHIQVRMAKTKWTFIYFVYFLYIYICILCLFCIFSIFYLFGLRFITV